MVSEGLYATLALSSLVKGSIPERRMKCSFVAL